MPQSLLERDFLSEVNTFSFHQTGEWLIGDK